MRARGYGDGLDFAAQTDLPGADRPEPLVPPQFIVGIEERMDYKGEALLRVDEQNVREQIRRLVDKGAQAFVVSLVNAVVNPAHEKEVERIILSEYPTHVLGAIPIVLSHRVAGRKACCAKTATRARCCSCTTRPAWRR